MNNDSWFMIVITISIGLIMVIHDSHKNGDNGDQCLIMIHDV